MRLSDLRISKKIGVAFLALVAGAGAMGGAVYVQMSEIDAARAEAAARSGELMAVISARGALARQENSLRGFMLTRDSFYLERIKKHLEAFGGDVRTIRQGSIQRPELTAMMDKLEADIVQWHKQYVDVLVMLSKDPATLPNALKLMTEGAGDKFIDPAEAVLDSLKEDDYARMAANARLQVETFRDARLTLIGGVAALLAAAVALGFLLSRAIARPVSHLKTAMLSLAAGDKGAAVPALGRRDEVGEMAKAVEAFKLAAIEQERLEGTASSLRQASEAERAQQAHSEQARASEMRQFVSAVDGGFEALASGNLTVRLDDSVGAEFEPVRRRFNESVGRLEDALGTVVTTIGAIRTGLSEITVASGDLSQRTEQQAASLEETVAALSEVTAGVNETASGAAQARGAAEAAMQSAEKGGAIVERAIEAMSGIERSSQQINQIIGVIDEIAFQTNLLALNAGVEAARAGEAGRGFAVVAQEVRGLAQRSAEAAKEIKGLISASREQVEAGVELVSASGASLKEIVAQVSEVSGVVGTIAASAREQAVSLKEVSVAADQMDKVTQQNAAMVEEATAAAQALSHETDALAQLMQRFQTHAASQMVPANTRRHISAPSSRPVVQMRHSGRSGAQAATQSDARQDGWEEF